MRNDETASVEEAKTDKTSPVKTAKHNTYCSVCRVWYQQAQSCSCGRGMLLG